MRATKPAKVQFDPCFWKCEVLAWDSLTLHSSLAGASFDLIHTFPPVGSLLAISQLGFWPVLPLHWYPLSPSIWFPCLVAWGLVCLALILTHFLLVFPGGSGVKSPPGNAGDLGLIPGSGRSLEKEIAIHSSILAWRIPWTEETLQCFNRIVKSWTWLSD